jgi:hypothetical protein
MVRKPINCAPCAWSSHCMSNGRANRLPASEPLTGTSAWPASRRYLTAREESTSGAVSMIRMSTPSGSPSSRP